MFRGNHPTRVDEKGRLKLPADYKREVDEQYGAQFYITSLDGKRAKLYPLKSWEAIEASLQKMSPMDPVRKKFLDVTNYYGQMAEMDAQGRLLIPGIIRKLGPVEEEVQVIGRMSYLEVVREEVLEAQLKKTAQPMPISLSESDLTSFSEKTKPLAA
jgi:MraZ protein